MRTDEGLNSDLERLPQLSWLLFLRAFDALEAEREITEVNYRPAIEAPYRWRDWAADPDFTGDDLLTFVNSHLPDDRDKPGLLPYLRSLSSDKADDPRNVLSAVFQEIYNRMLSGFLLRDLVTKIDEIDFTSADDIHTMAYLYESLLKEVRDAAGDSGEFYTPRPVIRFMVEQSFLELGESILDPACGTGGFLLEAYEELEKKVRTVVQRRQLHKNLRGIEKKPQPYLMCMMNLVLHGIESPNVIRTNALVRMSDENNPASRVNVVLTNPPFGGEEENSVSQRFAEGYRTKETAWLFLQAVIDKLKPGGRCAIVLPNGILFGDGVGIRIKEKLLRECNLHTVVRLPQGVFAPYTLIPANLLFFEKSGPTKDVWFYEILPPEGRKGYTKTKPMRYEEFADCAAWWGGKDRVSRIENGRAWRTSVADLTANGYNLDLTNPTAADDLAHRPPQELLADLVATEREVLDLLTELEKKLEAGRD
ncbi:SAM-dependent DNA methyltransferase [Amycolatopsis bartoniae]|nr:SAM-dependent DNA methyltransferase [Amycolatopsis bartoniae]